MYGEKQEETDELKLDLEDIKNMYKAQVSECYKIFAGRLPRKQLLENLSIFCPLDSRAAQWKMTFALDLKK